MSNIQEEPRAPQDWLIRVGGGGNFAEAIPLKRYDFKIRRNNGYQLNKVFRDKARRGDRLWFIKRKSGGEIIAMAIFERWSYRSWIDDLTDAQIGYENHENITWAATMFYTDMYDFRGRPQNRKFLLGTTPRNSIISTNQISTCAINLPLLYENVMMYGNILKR